MYGIKSVSRWRRALALAALLLALFAAVAAPHASAHAVLLTAVPEPNTRLADSPAAISLTFNERLDAGLFYIKVFDDNGKPATNNTAVMTADRTGIKLELPQLKPGAYLVSYHVISEDGHPVGGSYPLAIGAADPGAAVTAPSPAAGGHQHGLAGGFTVDEAGRYLARGIYYATLLAAAGWALWLTAARRRGAAPNPPTANPAAAQPGTDPAAAWRMWTTNTLRVHIVALLLLIATHAPDYVGDGGWGEITRLFTSTSIGLSWLASLAIAILGLAVVGRNRIADVCWALVLLLVKSLIGHAQTAAGQPWPVIADFVHLLAAAVWVGGMWALLAKLRIDRGGAMPLLLRFSTAALVSIIVLVLTGTLSTMLYIPRLSYLLYTEWGSVLLAKVALALAVIIVAAFLRRKLSADDPAKLKRLLTVDITLMAAILLAVGVLTYLPPRPANEPLYWHQMGDPLHVTATITPNVPGTDNTFTVVVWLPKAAGDPKQVRLQLSSLDKPGVAPIDIAVAQFDKTGSDPTYGDLQRFSYRAQGPHLLFAGQWKLTVTVRNANDDETQAEKTFRVF